MRKIFFLLSFIFFFLLLFIFPKTALAKPVFGYVKDSQGRPLSNIAVNIYCNPIVSPPSSTPLTSYPSTPTATTRTNSYGSYNVFLAGPTWCKFMAGTGFITDFIRALEPQRVSDIIYNPPPPPPASYGWIQGYIKDNAGNFIGGARVLNVANNNLIAVSGSTGYFVSSSSLLVGTYTIKATKTETGYRDSNQINVTVSANTTTWIVVPGVDGPYLILRTGDGTANFGQVQGYVRDQNGQGINQAQISYQVDNYVYTVRTSNPSNDIGHYITAEIPAGRTINFTAAMADYSSQTKSITIVGGQRVNLDFQLTLPVGQVQGRVVENTQAGRVPVSGASVKNARTGTILRTTDQNGQYTISNIPAGTIYLRAEKTEAGYLPSATISVSIVANQTVNAADLILSRSSSIFGFVKDPQGRAIERARARTLVFGGTSSRENWTNSAGFYELVNLPSGNYTVSAWHPDYQSLSQSVTLYPGQRAQLDFTLTPLPFGQIEGYVKDQGGQPIQDVCIFIDNICSNIYTDANGHYLLDKVLAGNHTLAASKRNYRLENPVSVTVSENQTTQAADLILIGLGRIEGTTYSVWYNAEGQPTLTPLASVEIYLNVERKATSDSQGKFEIRDVDVGTYNLKGVKEGYQEQIIHVSVRTGETTYGDLKLNLLPGRLEGYVYFVSPMGRQPEGGDVPAGPLQDAEVTVYSFSSSSSRVLGIYRTDETGYYITDPLSASQYTVIAKKMNYTREMVTIEIVSNQTARQDFTLLHRPGEIKGVVQSAADPNLTIYSAEVKLTILQQYGPAVSFNEDMTYTTPNGRYSFYALPLGQYQIEVTHSDYQSASVIVEINSDTPLVKDFQLTPLLSAKGAIGGGVLFQNEPNHPVAFAKLTLLVGENQLMSEYTGEDGKLLIREVSAGSYQIRAEKNGYRTTVENVTVQGGRLTIVTIGLFPSEEAVLEGLVFGENGQLIENVANAVSINGIKIGTDSFGRFSLSLSSGTKTITISVANFETLSQTIIINPGFNFKKFILNSLSRCKEIDRITFCFEENIDSLTLMNDPDFDSVWTAIAAEIWRLRNGTDISIIPKKVFVKDIPAAGRAIYTTNIIELDSGTLRRRHQEIDQTLGTVRHEWGHLYTLADESPRKNILQDSTWEDLYLKAFEENNLRVCRILSSELTAYPLDEYACQNVSEFFAESFEVFYSQQNEAFRNKISQATGTIHDILKGVYNFLWNLPELQGDYPGPIAFLRSIFAKR